VGSLRSKAALDHFCLSKGRPYPVHCSAYRSLDQREFAITNKRVIVKLGLISIHTLEMNLSKVESINVDQNPFGRIFHYGSITVIGTGGTRELFHNIADPMEFRRQFLSQQS
jgi:hypothetical protein